MQGALGLYSMFVNFNDKEYRWDFASPDSSMQRSSIYQLIKSNKRKNYFYKYGMCIDSVGISVILNIDNPKNITPQNVAQKLKTYLLFS
jgi:hypothetical protein